VLNLAHPDVYWFVPIARPKASDPDKQVEEAAEALAEVMAARRGAPLWTAPEGMASHGLASVRLLLRRVALTPAEAKRKVFILGDAERLIPQESSQEAANALLKVMEEPPADTVFLLTASDPRRLLPTIRSRAVVLRLHRLPDAAVREFLATELSPAPSGKALMERVATAEGSIGSALAESGARAKARDAAESVLAAAMAGGAEPWERALRQMPWQARGDFTEMLDALAELLSDAARAGAGHAPRRPVSKALAAPPEPKRLVRAAERVAAAREAAQGNVNPQLLLAELSSELEEALCR
jgi:DNA polymerase-3 subunit delta'